MKAFSTALALAGLSSAFAAQVERKVNFPKYAEGKVIVELTSTSVLNGKREDVHARFFDELDKRLPPNSWTTKKVFDSKIFVGASLTLKTPEDIAKLGSIKGVKSVRPVPVVERPEIRDQWFPKTSDLSVSADLFPPNIMTGVDKVHATGNFGKGIKIGMCVVPISSIDYDHPALGGGFGPGFKVAGGYDFVGDDYPFTTVPDEDPRDVCAGHGTHVAGIIGADPTNEFNVTGVAYEASLYAYRIFGCVGGTDDDVIVESLIRAYNDGNDVITLSLGGTDGWTESVSSVVASRIAEQGRVVTIAAGNEGDQGAWFTASPSGGINVISIASANNIVTGPLQTAVTSIAGSSPIPYITDGGLSPIPVGDIALPLYALSKDSSIVDDGCNPLPASTPDLSGYVTLVRRGTCNFTVKLANIAAKGGKIVLIYNNGGSFSPINTGSDTAALIQDADGLFLLEQFIAGTQFTVSFPQSGGFVNVPNIQNGGLVSAFTTYGPTYDLYFKPAVAAPGGGILGLYPVPLGAYAVLSGTSMATPHAAGVAALILKAKGKGVAKGIRDLLETTSKTIPQSLDENAKPQTLSQQGAGLINAWDALNYQTVVTPGELLLNDTANWKGLHTIKIKNTGKKPKTYTLKHIPAGTAYSRESGTIQPSEGPVPQDNTVAAQVHIALRKVTVLPGLTFPVLVTITPPKQAEKARIPVVSGHIEIATAGETLHVSYLGAATDLRTVQVVDTTPDVLGLPLPVILDEFGVQEGPENYTWVGENYPVFAWRQVFGTAAVKLDLVAADIQLKTSLKKRGPVLDLISSWWPGLFKPLGGSFAKVPTFGPLFEYDYLPRNDYIDFPYYETAVPNVFANGTLIPYGQYKLLFRVLRVGGNPSRQEDYEVWLSPQIGVVEPQ
ncbi:subtilisin-like protein [Auricularia subglabra TFB-10046 SS5]|nr:subtilisin-like protein [Auricularia subglabra TFB-10046 SS5]